MFRCAALTALCLLLSGVPAYAADANGADLVTSQASTRALAGNVDWSLPAVALGRVATPTTSTPGNVDWSFRSTQIEKPASRPRVLPALYVSLAALQAFDAYSTAQGLSRGAQESNPLMQQVAGNTAGFWTLKAATAIVPMILAERMWRHNKVGAITLMIVANGVAAAVGANNAHVLHQLR